MTTGSVPETDDVVAYIGLGSNLDEPLEQVRRAIEELKQLDGSAVVACSSLYVNPPMGPADQPDYVNAVVAVNTRLEPEQLLDGLQDIERAHGRERNKQRKWGPRTLDLDLLVFGDIRIDTDRLTVPHPGLAERAFVIVPLLEVNPDLDVPRLGPVQTLADSVDRTSLVRME